MVTLLRGSHCQVDNSFKKQFVEDLDSPFSVSSEEPVGAFSESNPKIDTEIEGVGGSQCFL